MSASASSKYAHLVINKDGKTANIQAKTIQFNYYESLYSPIVTATLSFIDSGGSVKADKEQDSNERLTNIHDGLPITGLEDVEIKIESKFGTLDFKKNPLKINSAPIISQESNRQTVFLSMNSAPAVTNNDSPIARKFKGSISDTVTKILTNDLKITENRIKVDKTRNSYAFVGKRRGGLDIINDLCRRSIPVNGDAGYFFYETQDGFNFRSIDKLIEEGTEKIKSDASYKTSHTYFYDGVLSNSAENDFKILIEPRFTKDQDVLTALKEGHYYSHNIFYDPRTQKKDEKTFKLEEGGLKQTLGKPKLAQEGRVNSYTKVNYYVLDIGSQEPGVDVNPNNDPREWLATSRARYNLLHTQMMFIQVPCNLELKAGEVIRCEIEFPGEKKEEGAVSQQQSGNYLILHLCHSFNAQRSFTSMTVVRDTYGLHTNKG